MKIMGDKRRALLSMLFPLVNRWPVPEFFQSRPNPVLLISELNR
jgi:hypothetical protein